ncbi:hypothetical protein HYDPIDRAFT_107030 [Hydnomerulius pinastri MD-312]|nr:hypothetical protein HYDPIDRAFT_107030 [Hydnomerulius pinastri MD-312]
MPQEAGELIQAFPGATLVTLSSSETSFFMPFLGQYSGDGYTPGLWTDLEELRVVLRGDDRHIQTCLQELCDWLEGRQRAGLLPLRLTLVRAARNDDETPEVSQLVKRSRGCSNVSISYLSDLPQPFESVYPEWN